MVEELFDLYDSLIQKCTIITRVIWDLSGDDNGFLSRELLDLELLIVKALGGNEDHHKHIFTTDLFYDYKYDNDNEISRQELIDYIKKTIENGLDDPGYKKIMNAGGNSEKFIQETHV